MEVFARNIIAVYFIYGLAFFCMGLAILLEVGHSSELYFAKALRSLAIFGLIHGSHEWFEMFLLIEGHIFNFALPSWIQPVRIILLAVSFLMLIAFGVRLVLGVDNSKSMTIIIISVICIWIVGLIWLYSSNQPLENQNIASDVFTRYSLAIPGAALTAWGLVIQRRRFIEVDMHIFGRDVVVAAVAFAVYGGIGQLFASSNNSFPFKYINAEMFLNWFGFPVQLLRALTACIAAVFIIHSLRSFAVENVRRITQLKEAQLEERLRLEELRGELLNRTVKAQEAERQRIALELHDETGQTLTAISMGLRGLTGNIDSSPSRAIQQAQKLEQLASDGILELQRLVTGLRPPQLDDLGLVPALRWYASDVNKHFKIHVDVISQGSHMNLPPELRIVLFRIAQEAITNVVRHAEAIHATIRIVRNAGSVDMAIEDDGKGFDVEKTMRNGENPCWGLLGMVERASLVRGTCNILSSPGKGTLVNVSVNLEKEVSNA
jgi:signal transduction histidine kinase